MWTAWQQQIGEDLRYRCGYHNCTDNREVLVSHANALLTPKGRLKLATSSRPHHNPNRTPTRTERRIINLRFLRRWGPHRIGYHLHMPHSTVSAVLRRYKMPLLRHLDQNTGLAVRRPQPRRYEHPAPGDLIHIDIKKLGRIPDGGGHRKLGRTIGNRHNKKQGRGYSYVHHAVDDHSRLAYSEILGDDAKKPPRGSSSAPKPTSQPMTSRSRGC